VKRGLIFGGAALILLLIVVASARSGGPKGEKVYVEPAKVRRVESVVNATGEVDPRVKVNISAHTVGKIERLYFKEGDLVKRGQKLVDLEKPNYIAQRDRVSAELRNRTIEVNRARLALKNAELNYRRAESLRTQGIQAQELFDRAQLELENARAAVASAEEGVRQAQATLVQAGEDLSRTTIVSPIDGKVVAANAHEGEVVITGTMNNPGSVIAVIADLSEILVNAEVGETEVVGIRVGQPVKIKVDAVPDQEYRGRVVEIGSSAAIKQQAGSGIRYFNVKAAIDDPDERLRPGMTSQVSIVTSTAASNIAVPIQSVVERTPKGADEDAPKKKYVYLANGKKARQVEVTTGISDATHVTVLSGIKTGDAVITGPFRTLKNLSDGETIYVGKEERKAVKSGDDEKDADK
jgi:HlyD family secretion protein